MRERLPIWFQSLAIVCLCAAWMTTVGWVGRHYYAQFRIGGFEWSVASVLGLYIPLAILFLGVRFTWRFGLLCGSDRKTPLETFFYSVVFILILAVLGLMLFLPAVHRVRDASSFYATSKIVDAGRPV
jgi:fumarate reductase subunit D